MKGLSLLPYALRPFQINCAPSNLGITRTWICRLNFAQKPIFQAWSYLTSLKFQTRDPHLKIPPGGLVLRIFTSWKNPSTSAEFEHANLGCRNEHITPRLPRQTRLSRHSFGKKPMPGNVTFKFKINLMVKSVSNLPLHDTETKWAESDFCRQTSRFFCSQLVLLSRLSDQLPFMSWESDDDWWSGRKEDEDRQSE